jgi:hypothetical protein
VLNRALVYMSGRGISWQDVWVLLWSVLILCVAHGGGVCGRFRRGRLCGVGLPSDYPSRSVRLLGAEGHPTGSVLLRGAPCSTTTWAIRVNVALFVSALGREPGLDEGKRKPNENKKQSHPTPNSRERDACRSEASRQSCGEVVAGGGACVSK